MKVIVKRFWAYFLAAIIVIGSVSVANFSAMAEVIDKNTQTGYVIDVVYNQDYTAAVLQGNIQAVNDKVELLSLKNQAGEVLNPNNFNETVSENGAYTFLLTYHYINEGENQHEHTGHEEHTEKITVQVDKIVYQQPNEIQLSNYTVSDFENTRAANNIITDIPNRQITFKGYQLATYKDKAQNPDHEELVTVNFAQENQNKYDAYMRSTGFQSGFVNENSMGNLALTGLTFDSLVTIIGNETHKIAYIKRQGDDIFYLTESMRQQQSSQATVLAQAVAGQKFEVRYRTVDPREVKLNLNRSRAQSLGITFTVNEKEPKWNDGTPMDSVYVTAGTVVSITATYPNRYNVAGVVIDNNRAPLTNPNEQATFEANKLTKLFIFQIVSADQVGSQELNIQWNFQDTRPTDGRLIALVDSAGHPGGSNNNQYFYSGSTRLARFRGVSTAGKKETYLNLKGVLNNGSYVYVPSWYGGPFSGVISGPYANGASFDTSYGLHGIPLGNDISSTTAPDGFQRNKFTPYNIKLWNSETGGRLNTFNNISGSTGTNLNNSSIYTQSKGEFKTRINGSEYGMLLGSYTGSNEQAFEYDFEWGAPHGRLTNNELRYGEYPSIVLRYDTYDPNKHMVYTDANNQPQSTAEPVYTEYLSMPLFPDLMSTLVTQNGMTADTYDGRQLPVNKEVTHTTSDGATVKIKLKSIGYSHLEVGGYRADKIDKVTTPRIYKYEITVTNPTRDIRLSIGSDAQQPGYQGNTILTKGKISGLYIGGNKVNGIVGQVPDHNLSANCTHGGKPSTVRFDGQASVDGSNGNYGAISVTVPKGYGNVTTSVTQNGHNIDPKHLQLCYVSSEVDPNTHEEVTYYHYHYFGKQIDTDTTKTSHFARLIEFNASTLYNVDVKYKQGRWDYEGFVSGTDVTGKNFVFDGGGQSQANSKLLITEVLPNIPSGQEFGGWKLSLLDGVNNRYFLDDTNTNTPLYLYKDGINGSVPFVGADLLDLGWLYEQMDVNSWLKNNYPLASSNVNFEVRAEPIFHQVGSGGTTMKRGESQFFYQGSLGSISKNAGGVLYSRFIGEKESRSYPSGSNVVVIPSEETPSVRRFSENNNNYSNLYQAVKYKYNETQSIVSKDNIPAGEQTDTSGADWSVIAQLFYDRIFNVQYDRASITNLGISMDGIEDNLGEYTLTSGNGSVVTLNPSLANNNSLGGWKIKELKDANIPHNITVTNGKIDLSTLSDDAKRELLKMDSTTKTASYTTVTLVQGPPLQIVDQSREDCLWFNGDDIGRQGQFIWVDLLSRYGTIGDIADNINRTLVRVRNGQETEYTFGNDNNTTEAATHIIDTTQELKRVRISLGFKQGFTDVQDGDQFYIKLSLKSNSAVFVKPDNPITIRMVNLMDDKLIAGIDGMVSMPSNVILSEQTDGSLASSTQDIKLNAFGHAKDASNNWDDSAADYNWKTRETYIDVSVSNPLVTLISSRSNTRRFQAQVQDVAGNNLTANRTFGRFKYGATSVDADHLLQYKVVGSKPIGADRGEIYTGTLTFMFTPNSTQ